MKTKNKLKVELNLSELTYMKMILYTELKCISDRQNYAASRGIEFYDSREKSVCELLIKLNSNEN